MQSLIMVQEIKLVSIRSKLSTVLVIQFACFKSPTGSRGISNCLRRVRVFAFQRQIGAEFVLIWPAAVVVR
jgi:hypothetical protein